MLWKFRQHLFVCFYLLLARDGWNFVFSRNMTRQYTAKEACEALTNDDNFGEFESADSLNESFTDSISSCSEVDSNPDNDYCGRTIAVETPNLSPAKGRPRTKGKFNSRLRTRGGRSRRREHESVALHIIYFQTNDLLLQYLMMKLIHQKILVQTLKLMSLSLIFGRTIHQLYRTSYSMSRLD